MTDIQKQALKDILHLLVDKEELPVLKELASKLPPAYAAIVAGILDAGGPILIGVEDKAIDQGLA